MTEKIKILIAEHDADDITFLKRELKKANFLYTAQIADNLFDIENAIRHFQPDIILSDYNLPAFSGIDVFKLKQLVSPHTPLIFVSGAIGEENAIECIKSGVTDYALKDKLFTLPEKIKRALNEAREKQQKIKAEENLHQSEMNLSAIFDNTDTGFLLLDTTYNIVAFNKKLNNFARYLFGIELNTTQNIISLIQPGRKKEFVEMLDAVIDGNSISYETQYPQAEGVNLWFSIVGNPVTDREGKIVKACFAINDITKTKLAALKLDSIVKELTRKNNELEKINIELDKFVYSTSHDLRAPLLSLHGLIEMCGDFKNEPEKLTNLYDMMSTSVNRVDETIKNILFYSRNARTEIKPELLNIGEMAAEHIEKLRFIKKEREVKFILTIDDETPFYSDKARVSSIIGNLLSNAVKYQCDNEKNPTVKFNFSISGNDANIIIEDNGEGIPKNMQSKIFDMFVRTSAQSTGSGLGLYICREMIDKLGGSIQVVSEPDSGSIFIVRLPNNIPQLKAQHESSIIYR
jgi:PAS domain S-box-containing protein